MASLDVESLLTNIPLEETTRVCCDSLFSNDAKVNNIKNIDFKKLLRAKQFFLQFQRENYKQIDGVVMGSPLGCTLSNTFLCFDE